MAITDKFNRVKQGTTRPVATQLAAEKISGATSASLQSATGWGDVTAVHGIMYRIDSNNAKIPGSQIDWKAQLSGTTLNNFEVTAGTDDTYAIGAVVELAPTPAWAEDLVDGLLASLDQQGVLKDSIITEAKVAANAITADKIPDGEIPSGKLDFSTGIWWEEIGRTTLVGDGDVLEVTSLPDTKYLKLIATMKATGGTIDNNLTFNSDPANNYALALNIWDGNAESDLINQSGLAVETSSVASGNVLYLVLELVNVAADVKHGRLETIESGPGAANAPRTTSSYIKWANTTNAISTITITNNGTGSFEAGVSEIVVLGHN